MPQGSGTQTQADIHAAPGRQLQPERRKPRTCGTPLTMAPAYISRTVLSPFSDMKSATTQTFSGLAACTVELYSSSYSDDSRICLRDTNTGDRLELDGLTNAVLRRAVKDYLSTLGYRKEDASAAAFLRELVDQLARTLEKEEA